MSSLEFRSILFLLGEISHLQRIHKYLIYSVYTHISSTAYTQISHLQRIHKYLIYSAYTNISSTAHTQISLLQRIHKYIIYSAYTNISSTAHTQISHLQRIHKGTHHRNHHEKHNTRNNHFCNLHLIKVASSPRQVMQSHIRQIDVSLSDRDPFLNNLAGDIVFSRQHFYNYAVSVFHSVQAQLM